MQVSARPRQFYYCFCRNGYYESTSRQSLAWRSSSLTTLFEICSLELDLAFFRLILLVIYLLCSPITLAVKLHVRIRRASVWFFSMLRMSFSDSRATEYWHMRIQQTAAQMFRSVNASKSTGLSWQSSCVKLVCFNSSHAYIKLQKLLDDRFNLCRRHD